MKLRGVWTAAWPAFDYDTDLHPHSMAKVVAVEEWSRDYFKRLKRYLGYSKEKGGICYKS